MIPSVVAAMRRLANEAALDIANASKTEGADEGYDWVNCSMRSWTTEEMRRLREDVRLVFPELDLGEDG